ncbi:MAG: glycosyltransferase family 4 protein [Oscillospiraceae bacterium]|nr:glycosyltransferase family 4 protein [Oscillospiraceae bacterium]
MNIAIVTDTYFPDINGVTSSIYTLAESLRNFGHKVYIFTVSEPKEMMAKLKDDSAVYRFPSIPIFFIKPHRATAPFSARVIRLMRELRIDIIHTQTEFFMGFVGMNASHYLRLPVIHTYHTMLEDYTHYIARGYLATPKMAQVFSRLFCNMADSIIVPTGKVEKSLHSYGVKRPIYVIPTGIDLEPFRRSRYDEEEITDLKRSLGILPGHKVLLSLGRVAKEKSLDMIIRTMPQISSRHPEARLLVVGTGPALPELKALAASLGVSDRVIFSGAAPYSEIAKYYRIGDIFISCSVTETQGLTYYEAMASGLPVVARQDDSISSLLRNGFNSRLFRECDAIPGIVDELLTGESTLDHFSKNALISVQEYSAGTFAERVLVAYNATIDREYVNRENRKPVPIRFPVSEALRRVRLVMPHPSQFRRRRP